MTAEICNKTVAYTRFGSGEKLLVILHGWGCNKEMFRTVAEHFAKTYTVVVPDLCGFGESPEPVCAMTVADYAEVFAAFIASLGFSDVTLMGHSFGGRIILKLFEMHDKTPLPFTVSKVILTDAAGLKPKKTVKQKLSLAAYKTGRKILSVPPLKTLFPSAVENWRKKRGSADYNAASEIMKKTLVLAVNEDLAHCLPLVYAPTLLFWGEKDDATPLADAKRMEKAIPDAGLVVLAGGSHFAFLENTPYFLRVADAFLSA